MLQISYNDSKLFQARYSQARKSWINKGPFLLYKCAKMMCNNPKLDLVNINAYIKFDEILSICFQDIERKRNCE